MADNINLPANSGIVATSDDGTTAQKQVVALDIAGDGARSLVTSGNPLPIVIPGNPGIVGNLGSGATDSGNPVKTAGVYNSTPPTVTTGQRVDHQSDANGNHKVVNVAGTAIIGKVTTDQTTHGTTDLVAADITKIGGTALSLGQALAASSLPVILPAATVTTLTPPTTVTVTQTTGTNLHAVLDSGTTIVTQATAANLNATVVNAAGAAIMGKVGTDQTTHGTTDLVAADITKVGGSTLTIGQQLAAASLPVILPAATVTSLTPPAAITGFALEAGHLSTIDTKTPALGQALAAAAVPVVLTAIQQTALTPPTTVTVTQATGTNLHAVLDSGTTTVTQATGTNLHVVNDAGAAIIGKIGTDQTTHGTTDLVAADLTKVGGSAIAIGQQLAAASLPVILPAATVTSLTPPAAITGFALEAGHIASMDAKMPAIGQQLAAASQPVVLTAIQQTALTPPTTVTVIQGTGTNLHAVLDASAAKVGVVTTDQTTHGTSDKVAADITLVGGLAVNLGTGTTGTGTLRVVQATDQPTQTNLMGQVSSSDETGTIYSGTTALTPQYDTIVASTSGVTNLLALVSSKRIRVLMIVLTANGAVNVKFQSHTTPTDLTGLFYLSANGGFSAAYCPVGHFQTNVGEALDINLSASVAVGGYFVYVTV